MSTTNGEETFGDGLRGQGIDSAALDAQIEAERVAAEKAAVERGALLKTLKADALLKELQNDHWFWCWGDSELLQHDDAPEGMIEVGFFLNAETGFIKGFFDELQQDGVELLSKPSPTPGFIDRYFMDRVKFMEWLILRYVRDTPTYTSGELEAYADEKVAEARAEWEAEAEERSIETGQEVYQLELEAKAARSGWVPLSEIAKQTGVEPGDLYRKLGERYSLGVIRWRKETELAARWFDAFEWMREHFEGQWDANDEKARGTIEFYVDEGMEEAAAVDKVRREFINERAARPISRKVGIHTLTDADHLSDGSQHLGFSSEGKSIMHFNGMSWEPYGEKEAEAGFPLWGDGPDY